LRAENAWTERRLAPWSELRDTVLAEMKARIVADTASPPVRHGPFLYYYRFRAGEEYPVFCRRRAGSHGRRGGPEELLLDGNRLAREAHGEPAEGYLSIGALEMSPDHQVLAFATDTVGRRLYELRFLDTRSGAVVEDRIPGAAPNVVWARNGEAVFYTRPDPETLRWSKVMLHRLGEAAEEDALVYEETDDTFWVAAHESRSREFVLLHCEQTDRAEAWAIPSADPAAPPRRLIPRGGPHEFEIDHFRDRFLIRTNRGAPDFRLVGAPEADPADEAGWEDLVPPRTGVQLEGFELFETHLALFERRGGRQELRLVDWDSGAARPVPLPGPVRALDEENNPEAGAREVRVVVSTPKTPATTLAVALDTGRRRTLKREKVPGFRAADYRVRRLSARGRDGTRIPISLVHHREHPPGTASPLLLYGYGAYGISMDPAFSKARFSLLDRGFSFAIAHVRGGQELGRAWYEAGRQEEKPNTFHDFIACAAHLRRRGMCDPRRMYAMGGSAGGLLMGAVLNEAPGLFDAVVAMVPFVDVLNTMLDPDIPLTTAEYDEWGDPNRKEFFELLASYAPYENVPRAPLPHVLATSGLHDSQVQFWEPTKWVQRLRERNTRADRLILLRTNMDAGHGGRSGRYRGLEEIAEIYAFLIGISRSSGIPA
jgi:oligopeptidase B